MPKVRENTTAISLNASGGAYVDVACTIPARHVIIEEDPSVTAQGFNYKDYTDNFTVVKLCPAGSAIELGNTVAMGNGYGPNLGMPMQNGTTAAYAGGTTYQIGDKVMSGGIAYICLAANTVGVAPTDNGAKWTVCPNFRAADKYIQAVSATASTTKLRIVEEE